MPQHQQQLFKHMRLPVFGNLKSGPRSLLFRLALVLLLVLLATLIFWSGRHGLRDGHDEALTFVDVLYFTTVTLSTIGYGDIAPVSQSARFVDAILVTPIRLAIWLIFIGTAYEFLAQNAIENWRITRIRRMLKNHTILCGYGRTGGVAIQELREKGLKNEQVIVLDNRDEALQLAADDGYVALRGDPVHAKSLLQAEIGGASNVILSLARDDTTALAVLTARKLAPKVKIIALVRDEENVTLIRHAGADVVIHQGRVSGYLLADAVTSRFAVGFLIDLMTCRGRFNLVERQARPEEVGKPLGQLGSRLIIGFDRGGERHLFSTDPDELIQAGDLLMVIEDRKFELA